MNKIFYVANIRIPTEKAHGIAIARSCESFASAGVETTLVVPRRRTPYTTDVFETYGVKPVFDVEYLPTIDLIREKTGSMAFMLQSIAFYASLLRYLYPKDRSTILYTRDPEVILFSRLGYKVVFECHLIPNNRAKFFSRAKRAYRIVVISEALKRAFVGAGFAPDMILVAPSGVDLSVFDIEALKSHARKMLDLPSDGLIALYTGNFTTMGHDKGISDILRALKDAPDVLFVAAGGSEKDRGRYVQEASELGVLGRVVLRGTTSQKMLALYQKAADVLLMPFPDTPHYRNHMSPVKMFEYMSAKRPIIASDLPTIREVLDEGTAIIVPPGDISTLAQTLRDFDVTTGEVLAKRAYDKVTASYTWQKRTERILEFISKGSI